MKELKKQHLEMLQLLESIEVMLQNGNSIHPNSVIRGAIQTAIGMEVDVTNVNDKCDNKQTAVEFIVEKLTPFNWTKEQMQEHYKDAIEQANKMFEEQIKDAWFDGVTNWDSEKEVEDYINKNFKSE